MWDGYTCYEKTKPNTIVNKLCPLYLTSNDKFVCNRTFCVVIFYKF